MPYFRNFYFAILPLFCDFYFPLAAQIKSNHVQHDWPQWLGPNRNGISLESGLLKSWPATGPKVLWRIPLGDGYSSVAISKESVYTLLSKGDDEFVICLDANSGKEIWRVRSDSTFKDTNGNGPRSTPAIHDEVVYAVGARGKLFALNAKTGKTLWQHDLKKEFNSVGPSDGGYATSPLVEGERLLVEAGGANGNAFVAFDKKTGQMIWKTESDKAGFSSPVAFTINGLRQIIFFSGDGVVSVSPENGKVYWRLPWKTEGNVNAALPLFIPPNKIFISSGYEVGAALLHIKNENGTTRSEEIWKSKVMQNKFPTSVLSGNYLYGFDNTVLKCINVNTGEEKWKQRGLGVGSLIYADGHLLVLSDKGKLVLVEASSIAYKEKAGIQVLNGRCITVPALAAGRLYLRNTKELVCLDVAEPL
jgi:outer membrane protein assembly factor BamB